MLGVTGVATPSLEEPKEAGLPQGLEDTDWQTRGAPYVSTTS